MQQKKIQEKFLVTNIIAPDLVSLNCLCQEQDPCHRNPIF